MSGDILSVWGQLTDTNRQKAAAFARKLLDKQQATVIVGIRETEYNTVREALDDLDTLFVPGMDLTIADHTGAVRHLYKWYPEGEAPEPLLQGAIRQDDASGLWIEEQLAEE